MPAPYRAAIVTVSDSVAQGTRQDVSGPAVARLLEADGWTINSSEVLPDDFTLIRERLEALAGNSEIDAIFTTGGTGVGPRDRTPEATTSVMERSLPGLAELMRREGLKKTPRAALSRAVAGVKGKTMLINLPGSPEGAEDSLKAILPILSHAVDVVRGEVGHEPVEGAATEEAAPESARAEFSPTSSAPTDAAPATEDTSEPKEKSEGNTEGVGNQRPV